MVSSVLIRILGDNSSAVTALKQTNAQMGMSRQKMERDFGDIARTAQRTFLAVSIAAGIGILALRSVNAEFDALQRSQRGLAATSKLSGAGLAQMQGAAASLRSEFQLSKIAANDLVNEVTRLAGKSGDLSQTQALAEAFLQVGAARGYDAVQTLQSVRQAILGIDEGTDKLFGVNPIVIYEEFGRAIGKSAMALNDQEKALALATRAMSDARKVGGSYEDFLESAAGKQAIANARLQDAKLAFSEAIQPARVALLESMADAFGTLGENLVDNQDEIARFAEQLVTITTNVGKLIALASKPITFTIGLSDDAVRLMTGSGGEWSERARQDLAARRGRGELDSKEAAKLWFGRLLPPAAPAAPADPEALRREDMRLIRSVTGRIPSPPAATTEPGLTAEQRKQMAKANEKLLDRLVADFDAMAEGYLRRRRELPGRAAEIFQVDRRIEAASNFDLQEHLNRGLAQRTAGASEQKDRLLGLYEDSAERIRDQIERTEDRVQRFADTFTSALMHMVQGTESLADSLRNVAASMALAFANDAVSSGISRVTRSLMSTQIGKQASAAAMAAGKTADAASTAGTAASAAAVAGGPVGWGLLAAGVGLSIVSGLLGGRSAHEREEEMFRAHLRALNESREQKMTVINLSLPEGPVDFSHPQMKESLAEGIESLGGTRSLPSATINYSTRRGAA